MKTRPDDAIIAPIPGTHPRSIGQRCAMVGNPMDVDDICAQDGLALKNSRGLLLSRLHYTSELEPGYSIIGPFIGAPYAAMLIESAIAWGVKEILFFGWCGAISVDIHIGDIIVPELALIDEGTSKGYDPQTTNESRPSFALQDRLKTELTAKNICYHEGSVWSTDAIFRETRNKIDFYQKQGVLGVEMEASALFSVGLFRNIRVGCLLAVSDEVNSHQWVWGFNNPKFKESRRKIAGAVRDFLINKKPIES
jgi:purine-nucleoside phosphorylase